MNLHDSENRDSATGTEGSRRAHYEPPTLEFLGTAEEAQADVGGFSGIH